MFNPEIVFIQEIEVDPSCPALVAPSCSSWWDINSECKCSTGCITPSWTNTTINA